MAAAVYSSVPAASHRFPVVRRRQIVIAKDNGYSLKPQFHYYPQILRPCFLAPLSVDAGKSAAGIVNELKPNKRSSNKHRQLTVVSVATDDVDVIPHHGVNDSVDKQLVTSSASPSGGADREEEEEPDRIALESSSGGGGLVGDIAIDRAINAAIVLAAGTFAITKLLTIDRDYWHGWTIYEILRYAPEHNWIAYEQVLKTNPVLAKMMISGVVYSLGDWIAQCYEGKPLFDFDRTRMLRSGLVGFTLHGSLSHYYYYFCEALFPFNDWWVVPAKVLFDQTAWAALWNSIYYVVLGFLRFESPVNVLTELKTTFWPMLTAGWKLWPFAHVVMYGVIPVEQRLLWVDCVELVWVTILSTYSNEKSEARHSESPSESNTSSLEKK